ncbi:hypothetical protein ABZT02_41585 [Streptomyces sp. NPDC005402]|uniref:hypothetical protein n=1 Tax=Streptomyces sp. NPDC005402 TaxID=3155338 RepID=UPI00339DF346
MSLQPNGKSDPSWLGNPIDARPLFGPELASLLDLLRRLRRNEWSRAAVPGWTVHDFAAHILGDYHGRLGGSAESHQRAMAFGETREAFIHRVNQEEQHPDHQQQEGRCCGRRSSGSSGHRGEHGRGGGCDVAEVREVSSTRSSASR